MAHSRDSSDAFWPLGREPIKCGPPMHGVERQSMAIRFLAPLGIASVDTT